MISSSVGKFLTQLAAFGMVGSIGFGIDASLLHLLQPRLGPYVAQLAAFPPAVAATWVLNRRFTFSYRRRISARELVGYILGNLIGWLVVNGVYFAFISLWRWANENPIVALICGAAVGAVVNFIVLKYFAFEERGSGSGKA